MRFAIVALFSAISVAVFPAHAAAQQPVPIEEYGKLPDVEDAVISPSGQRIALLTTIKGQRVILATEGKTPLGAPMAVGDMKVRRIDWIGEDRLLLVTSQTEDLGYGFTADKAEFFVGRVLPISPGVKSGIIFGNRHDLVDAMIGDYGTRKINGKWYGYYGAIELSRGSGARYGFDHGRPYLYRVDLQDFSTEKIANAANEGHDNDWLIDANGELAAELDIDDDTGKWRLRGLHNNVIAQGQNRAGRVWLVGLGHKGDTVIMGESGTEASVWYEIPLAGGEPKPFLDDIDVDRLYFDDTTGHLIGYLQGSPEQRPVFVNPDYDKRAKSVRQAFAHLESRMIDWTSGLDQVVVRTSGNKDSGSWFAVDLKNSRANAIAYERLAIGPEQVGAISTFEYTASDGLEMDGILTLPPGKEAKNLPVVVLPHGGPHAHDSPSFDWWAQAFASRGYAVLQPNFRGSTNRSQSFTRAGYGEWGRKMQTDKSDGLAALAEKGIADPKRACIVGASYGGYAALAGVTLQQGIYRCAVAVAPVSDIRTMFNEDYRATGRDRTTKTALLQQLGPRDRWDEVSPLRHAEQASAPIMLIHGKDDVVVPFGHSAKMADKLKDHDKPYEMVALDGEDHWLSLSETRKKMLASAVRFVEQHNPAD